ncbi:MAG: helix-turn-helix transcriptional regulator [Phascolarctobacterium sp.]|nr:helix-turn-helix transcriptional regulator [Phascolarctobacterium sp.]
MKLYDRIRARRIQLNMSQDELAKKLGYKTRSTIAKIEAGENDITQTKIVAFAKALDVTPGYLMGWEEPYTSLGIDRHSKIWTKEFKRNLPLAWENILLNADTTALHDIGYDVEEMNKLVDDVSDGKTEITFTLACEIADKLGVSLDELVGREEYKKTALDYENGLNGLELQLLNLLKQLSPEQKEFLLVQLEALVKRNKGSEETPF